MTGQSILDLMEVLDNELQLQAGESNVTRGLTALNAAQDYFESLISLQPKVLGNTTGTVTTTANTETTTFPSGVLRIDRLQLLDATTSLPIYDLENIRRPGGHMNSRFWPWYVINTLATLGKPRSYYTNGRLIYWDPLPDGTHTVRWYGLQTATSITAGGTFLFPDACALPFASFAVKLMQSGVGDASQEITSLATGTFGPIIAAMAAFNRDGGVGLEYSQHHDT